MALLAERGADDMIVVGGGVIQAEDIPKLQALGVKAIFDAEASTQQLIDGIERLVAERGGIRERSGA
jgi:methylmalonyl-CoA mutase, C-terminal domain